MRRKICILVLGLLLSALPLGAGAENALVLEGGTKDMLFAADGSTPMDHLFGSYLAVSPGENPEETVILRPPAEMRLVLQCLDVTPALSGIRLTVQGEDVCRFRLFGRTPDADGEAIEIPLCGSENLLFPDKI